MEVNVRRSIAIGIPCYNNRKEPSKALEHLYNVNWPRKELEVILVDDRSTDGTGEVMENFAKDHRGEYADIRVIHSNVHNVPKLRNMIAYETLRNGCYAVWYIDSDVYVPENALRRMAEILKACACKRYS